MFTKTIEFILHLAFGWTNSVISGESVYKGKEYLSFLCYGLTNIKLVAIIFW